MPATPRPSSGTCQKSRSHERSGAAGVAAAGGVDGCGDDFVVPDTALRILPRSRVAARRPARPGPVVCESGCRRMPTRRIIGRRLENPPNAKTAHLGIGSATHPAGSAERRGGEPRGRAPSTPRSIDGAGGVFPMRWPMRWPIRRPTPRGVDGEDRTCPDSPRYSPPDSSPSVPCGPGVGTDSGTTAVRLSISAGPSP